MTKLPEGAYSALFTNRNSFFKRDAPIINRLTLCKDEFFFDSLFRIDALFMAFKPWNQYSSRPVFSSPYIMAWSIFLEHLVLSSGQFGGSGKAKQYRDAQKEHREKILAIHEKAAELADLIRAEEIHGEKWGLGHAHDAHPLKLLNSTAANRFDETAYLFKDRVQDKLREAGSFGLKYFPGIPEIMEEISRQYSEDTVEVLYAMPVPRQISDVNFFLELFFNEVKECVERLHLPKEILKENIIRATDWTNIFSVSLGNSEISESHINEYKRKTKG